MKLPQITDTLSGYQYEWTEEHIKIGVSRIKNTDEKVSGEITVSTDAPGYSPHLHQALFNFSSTRSRDELAKRLNKQFDHTDWEVILEQLSVYTLERVRRGEPVVTLYASQEVVPPKYLLEPLIIQNLPNCIYGDPGSLKSNTALLLTQLIQLPWYDNPLSFHVPENSTSCLYLDWETDQDTLQWQLTKLQNGMPGYTNEVIPMLINYRRCAAPLARDIEAIRNRIEECNAKMIVIDSLGLACGGELKEAESALSFFAGLRQLHVTSLILAHNSKGSGETGIKKSIYGSVFFEAGMRNVWEIRKQQENGEDEAHMALFHKKSPPFGKLQHPIGFKLTFTEDSTHVSTEDPKNIGEFIDRMGTQERILNFLKDESRKVATPEIYQHFPELTENNIRNALSNLKKSGSITSLERGTWGLSYKGGDVS